MPIYSDPISFFDTFLKPFAAKILNFEAKRLILCGISAFSEIYTRIESSNKI